MSDGHARVIAEVAQGFEGDMALVRLYVRAAANAGADAVKFQFFRASELSTPDYEHHGLFEQLELTEAQWTEAVDLAHELGIEFYSDVFGTDSLAQLEQAGADGYKVHATDVDNTRLLETVAQTAKPVLLATGGCELEAIRLAIDILGAERTTLLFGIQVEPTDVSDAHIARLAFLAEEFGIPTGYMDHTAGSDALAPWLPLVALGMGATLVEKHMTLSRVAELEDHVSALSTDEFAEWVTQLRRAETALGNADWRLSDVETAYRTKVRRAVCAAADLAAGTALSARDIVLLRTGSDDVQYDPANVIGRTTSRAVAKSTPIRAEDLA